MARSLFALAFLAVASAFSSPKAKTVAPVAKAVASAAPKIDFAPIAAALPVALAASPANAFQGSIGPIPINLIVTLFVPVVFALPVALVVIGPGAIQQLKRVLSGESKNYFGEN